MPVGAIVGGIVGIGGALISSNAANKQSKAIQGAADQNSATHLQIFNQQRQDLMPWMNTGKAALSQIEKLLGLSPGGAGGTAAGGGAGGGLPGLAGGSGFPGLESRFPGLDTPAMLSASGISTQPVGAPAQVPENALAAAQPAGQFDSFYNSPGYQFRLQQGQRQLNTGLASKGQLFSGDAGRAAIEYGQNFASNEFNDHLNRLFNVAGMGQTSTGQSNALASNYANNVSQNNMTAAQARASSYGTQANIWGNALGTLGGMGMKYWG